MAAAQAGGLLSALIPLVHGLSTAMVWSGTTPRYRTQAPSPAVRERKRRPDRQVVALFGVGSAGGEICE